MEIKAKLSSLGKVLIFYWTFHLYKETKWWYEAVLTIILNISSRLCLQRWQKSGTHLEHLVSRFCLDSEMALDGMDSSRMLVISPCELSAYTQRWEVPFSWPRTPVTSHLHRTFPRHTFTASKTCRDSCSDGAQMHEYVTSALLTVAERKVYSDFLTPLHCFIMRRNRVWICRVWNPDQKISDGSEHC